MSPKAELIAAAPLEPMSPDLATGEWVEAGTGVLDGSTVAMPASELALASPRPTTLL